MLARLLSIVLVVQVLLGSLWTLTIASVPGRGDFGMLPLFLLTYLVLFLGLLIGIWAFWRRPPLRRRAAWVIAMPFVFWFLPSIVKTLAGGHLSGDELATIVVSLAAACLLACLVVPARAAGLLPQRLFRSPVFNWLLIVGLVAGWLFPVLVIAWLGSSQDGSSQGDTGYALAYGVILGALYLVGLGGGSLLTAAWGWMGLRGNVAQACRKLHVTQLVLAVPGLFLGGATLVWLVGQR